MVELSVFAALVLIAFTFLVVYMQKMNGEQYVLMEGFRRSLQMANDNNSVVSYSQIEDKTQTDIDEPLGRDGVMRSESSYVHWSVPDVEEGTLVSETDIDTSADSGQVKKRIEENDPERKFVYRFNYNDWIHDAQNQPTNFDISGTKEVNLGVDDQVRGVGHERTVELDQWTFADTRNGKSEYKKESEYDEDITYTIVKTGADQDVQQSRDFENKYEYSEEEEEEDDE